MKLKIVLLTALCLAFTSIGPARSKTTSGARGGESTRARSSAQARTIEQLARDVATAWGEGKLGSLDAKRPYVGSVRVVVEATVGEPPLVERKTFKTLAQVDRWFKSREREDGPARNIGTLVQCNKGVCTFEQEGMLHNNLYLKKITYGMRKGQPYIKAIYIEDGA